MSLADKILSIGKTNPVEQLGNSLWQRILDVPKTNTAQLPQPPAFPSPASAVPLWQKIIGGKPEETFLQTYNRVGAENTAATRSVGDPNATPGQKKRAFDIYSNMTFGFTGALQNIARKGVTKAVGGVADDLAKEARKYKTAEEFVGAQTPTYHGSPVPLKKFSNKKGGVFFTDEYADATGFAGSPDNVYEGYLNFKKPLVIDAKGAKWDNLNTKWGKSTKEIVSNAEKQGYDGVTFKNIVDNIGDTADWGGQGTIHYAIKPEDAFVNESQLIDIWNKAQLLK